MQPKKRLKEISCGQLESKTPKDVNIEFRIDDIRWLSCPALNALTGGGTAQTDWEILMGED
ncbi:MAG: hypothetical protein HQK81_02615 [Desulfovibrionaceae bacterium]|nr:hypothetical protein [Desulfovibrionaceae bacterium]MBF0512938.1 hypothetical protein [Desulfovibrionaceae bacterium]